jgi:flagellin-like hook-associated protein FlgL
MDPNTTLDRIRELVTETITAETNEHKADICDELASLVEDLDNWLCQGGFKPNGWNR